MTCSLSRRDERERDAGVAARRFDDDGVLVKTPRVRVFNHRHADAVLHAAERIEEFALEQDRGTPLP
jgi:hypothetical protein